MKNRRSLTYRERALQERWLEASEQFPVLFLTGPRQGGKTTVLQHLCTAERRYVTLDDLAVRTLAKQDPELFLQRFSPPVLIDEVQYAPQLLSSIKLRVDRQRQPGAFWLTGSQQFSLMQGISETLAGRVAIVNLLGFSRREKEQRETQLPPFLPTSVCIEERIRSAGATNLTSVYEEMWWGSFPALATQQITNRDLFYRSYVQTYLERDIRDLVKVGDLESFHRFVRACAARTGQLLNYSDLARDCAISVNTARSWLSVLVASFQVYLLPPYHSNLTARLYKTPKLYFLDTGLCAYLTEWSSPQTLESGAMSGAMFETYVFTELLKSWWHQLAEVSLYYFRDKDGREIDLLISRDGRLYPLEIKKTANPQPDAIKVFMTLQRFKERRGPGGLLCLYPTPLPFDANNMAIPVGLL
jgi:predicted AAA+ superfamily ATPase